MNPSEEKLSKALRELAAISPQEAPAEVGMMLVGAFRRHHRRRYQAQIASVVAVAACLVLFIGWFWTQKRADSNTAVIPPPQTVQQPATSQVASTPQGGSTGAEGATPVQAQARHSRRSGSRPLRRSAPSQAVHAAQPPVEQFVVLPFFDPDVPVGQSRMVRLEVPGASLRLVGYPVDEELAERRVVTDILLAQDGTPYAMRLVRTKAIH
jgi:hypothetical protein